MSKIVKMQRKKSAAPGFTLGGDTSTSLNIPNLTGFSQQHSPDNSYSPATSVPLTNPASHAKPPVQPGRMASPGQTGQEAQAKLAEAQKLFASGNLQQSERVCQAILAQDGNHAGALLLIGMIGIRAGNYQGAEPFLRAAIQSDPSLHDAYNAHAVALQNSGKNEEALAVYRKAIELKPDSPQVHYNRANLLKEMGQIDEAIVDYEKAIQLKPDYAKAYNNLGILLQGIGRAPTAITCLEKAIAIDPELAEAHKNLGNLYVGTGELDKAGQCFDKALRIRPGYPCAIAGHAGVLEKQGKYEEAYQMLKPVVQSGDTSSDNLAASFAHVSKYAGKREEAITFLKEVLARDNLHVDSRLSMLFNLGKLLDSVGRYDEAFDYYRQGNDLKPLAYDAPAVTKQFDNLIMNYTSERMKRLPRPSMPSNQPIFILGMPRSGTSLTEQILASHPQVFGAGELEAMKQIVERVPATVHTSVSYPFCLDALQQKAMDTIAESYLNHVRGLMGEEQRPRFTDKMPHNFLHIGLIHLLFPQAPIIHCVREPLDTCLSIYFHDFAGLHEYSYKLDSLGHYFQQYQRLMDFWKNTLKIPMFEVRYEDMVQDQEKVSRDLLDYCELPWDESCLQFHKTDRIVKTASYQQVREPIYTKSAGRWHNYEQHLQPLQQALGLI